MSGVEGQPEAPSQRTKGALLTHLDRLASETAALDHEKFPGGSGCSPICAGHPN
jgi:hypothetical protein